MAINDIIKVEVPLKYSRYLYCNLVLKKSIELKLFVYSEFETSIYFLHYYELYFNNS